MMQTPTRSKKHLTIVIKLGGLCSTEHHFNSL